MAESDAAKIKVQGIGLPFDPGTSSCSCLKPAFFEWTTAEQPLKVCVDSAVVTQKDTGGSDKFGWICESRAIARDLAEHLRRNFSEILPCYRRVFTCERELLSLDARFGFCFAGSNLPWIRGEACRVYPKTRLCSMIASPKAMCPGHLLRHRVAQALKGRIDIFGGVIGSPRLGNDFKNPWDSKLPGLRDYMFSIVMENDRYATYFTEKLTDCFAAGTIPVYWGAPDIGDYFNAEGILPLSEDILSRLSPDLYHSRREAVRDNFERVLRLKSADDCLFEGMVGKRSAAIDFPAGGINGTGNEGSTD